jgi:hypothetical protein
LEQIDIKFSPFPPGGDMRRGVFFLIQITAVVFGLLFFSFTIGTDISQASKDAPQVMRSISAMPLAFTKNGGQWPESVLFCANSGGATMWFTKEGVTYQFTRRIDRDTNTFSGYSRESGQAGMPILPSNTQEKDSLEQLVLTAKFVGANANPEVIAEGQMEYKCNYFIGNDPSKWHTDVPNYEAITLKDIYPGINLKYSGDGNGQSAYEFMVAPGSDIAQIKVEYEGAEKTSIDADGRMVVTTKWGDMTVAIKSPIDSSRYLGKRSEVRAGLSGTANFSQLSEKTIGFATDRSIQQALGTHSVVLSYSTYLGGGDADEGHAIAVDDSGCAYVTGAAGSGFPNLDPYQTYQGGWDVFVTKFSSSGNSLIYSTYLGGGDYELGASIAVDGNGNAYVTGHTKSSNFPTLNPYQGTNQGGDDAFVTKLSSSGNSLVYSTYFGGTNNEEGRGMAVDGSGYAYVTGRTWSSDFPIINPYQATLQGFNDVFVTKFSSTGNNLIYSTYLGGGSWDEGYDVAVDGSGYAYVTGTTTSSDFPTLNPYQATFQGGNYDAFIAKLSSLGNSLIYSTFLGGEYDDIGSGIAVDGGNNAYVTGQTVSSDFPTLNPYQGTNQGNTDVFVSKISSSGNSLVYSTYLGGEEGDIGWGIAVNGNGNAFITGCSYSSDFPTSNPSQAVRAGYMDVVITELNNGGDNLIYSTYLGGGDNDLGYSIAIDGSGSAYVTGYTWSSDFPTLDPYQTDQINSNDAFVTKLSYYPPGQDYQIISTPDTADVFFIKQADIDGDNFTDVIYTGNTSDSLYIAYGKDSTLETPRNYLKVTKAALVVDFVNGDSLLDIVAHTTEKVYVLLNLGNRNFSIDSMVVSPSYSRSESEQSVVFPAVATGYFNSDAYLDVVVSENEILFGDGSGEFPTSTTLPFSFDAVGVGDFDRDGIDDIVVTANDSAFIYRNDGSGNMTQSTSLRIGYLIHDFTSVAAGMDLNHDGKTDFVVVTGNTIGTNDTSVVTMALGNGTGGVASSDTLRIVGTVLNLALADFDKDHDLDISLVNATTRSLVITLNNGSGDFASPVSIPLGYGTSPLYALINADIDRNGAPDFVIGGQDGNSILLAVSKIPDDPILPDEMVTTGYNNVTIRVENPLGLVISQSLRTVAGSAYWRRDADNNGVLDESAYDYNLQYGEYKIVITTRPNAAPASKCDAGIRIDGSVYCTAFLNYGISTLSKAASNESDSLIFYYTVEPVSSMQPPNGQPTYARPIFDWSKVVPLASFADSFHFQLDRYYDFQSPIIDVSGLTKATYRPINPLGLDSVFYWHFRSFKGGAWTEFSRTFAAYVSYESCCLKAGDANNDTKLNLSDVSYIINRLYRGGPDFPCRDQADANGDTKVNLSDVSYIINKLYRGGPAPSCP